MANRRMFSLRLIDSAKFLKMPISTQCLYFHLGMRADDDGIVEAYNVIKSIGCSEDDLKVLVSKRFVQVLNEDLVTYILDWTENNSIRPDRKIDSIYKNLLLQMYPSVKLIEKRERADKKKKSESTGISNGQPTDNQRTAQVRLGKVSLGKDKRDIMSGRPDCVNASDQYSDDLKSKSAADIPYADIIQSLNDATKQRYQSTSRATQNKIKARWNEGFRLDDFLVVIKKKVAEWLGTDMEKYLRPETLFGPKFEGYLNQPKSKNEVESDNDLKNKFKFGSH